MTFVEDALLFTGSDKEELFWHLGKMVMNEFMNYCHRDDIPEEAESVLLQMLLIKYNRLGSEGVASENFGGVSQSFDSLPASLIPQLNRFRKLKTL